MAGIEIRERPSPNRGPRRGVDAPDLVILHYTNMATPEAALDRLCDPAAEVSAHYLIEPNGAVWRLVAEDERAWHAGVSVWEAGAAAGVDVNSRSIGIELAHPGHAAGAGCAPFPEPQMAALERVLPGLLSRWSIPASGVLGHSDVAPGRKGDPGEKFDWARLAREGLAEPAPNASEGERSAPDARVFLDALRRVGFGDWPLEAALDAFRRRWRPAGLGAPLAPEDMRLALALARRRDGAL